MRHRKKVKKLGRTASHRKALLSNLATALIEHKRIVTTEAKAKALRPFVEKLITKAKRGYVRERDNLLPEGQKVDLHARRFVARFLRRKAVVQELFESVAPVVVDRPGGYTRIVKLGRRRGDGARMALIELVDWSAPQDGQIYLRQQREEPAPAEVVETPQVQEEEATATAGEQPVEEHATPQSEGEAESEEEESAAVAEGEDREGVDTESEDSDQQDTEPKSREQTS